MLRSCWVTADMYMYFLIMSNLDTLFSNPANPGQDEFCFHYIKNLLNYM